MKYRDHEFDHYFAVLLRFGGSITNPSKFEESPRGFQNFLSACGVKFFAKNNELITPRKKEIAKLKGYEFFLPSYEWWVRAAANAKLMDHFREHLGKPIFAYNWWRPTFYNDHPDIDGAPDSDHLRAEAVDYCLGSQDNAEKVLPSLRILQKSEPWLKMSIGFYGNAIHVGLLTKNGIRSWYGS